MSLNLQIARFFNSLGLDVRRIRPSTPSRNSMAGALAHAKRLGLSPRTVIDVGVADATPALYNSFPDAQLICVEPLVEFEPALRQICAARNAKYVLAAAGDFIGNATLHVHPDRFGSSLFQESQGPEADGLPRTVPITTIDQIALDHQLTGPFLIKVDVQGAELQVLAGAAQTLAHTEAVVLEVSLFGFLQHAPQFPDVITRMKQLGFVPYDFFELSYRPLDGALAQLDVLFVREESDLRRSHLFITPEQREQHDRRSQARWLTPGRGN
jgi:FkbM family methyltransferase